MEKVEHLKLICPLTNSEVLSRTYGHKGGILTSASGDIKITIPKGAIKSEDMVTIATATDLYGPGFAIPSQFQTTGKLVSPYYWIGVAGSYNFQKPIQVEFEHFSAVITSPSHYVLLACEDSSTKEFHTYDMLPTKYHLNFKVNDDISLCTFETYDFCSYCLLHCYQHHAKNRIGAYYLKPKNFQHLNHFSVEIWFSFPISHCSKRNKELYAKENMKLDTGCSYIFETSCGIKSKNYFTISYDDSIDGWHMDHSLSSIIPTEKVNFYNYYKNDKDLRASEESSSYPPRFIIHVKKKAKSAINDLDTNIMVSLHNKKGKRVDFIQFKLFIPCSARAMPITTKNSITYSEITSTHSHCCDKGRPELKELVKYSLKIATYWKEIAINLEIPGAKISTIDINHPNDVKGKCYEMFDTWLQTKKFPCWCSFIKALYACDVGLHAVAEEAKAYFKMSYENKTSTTSNMADNQEFKLLKAADLNDCKRFLKDIPDNDLNYFISCLLPNDSAVKVIKDIKQCGKEDKIEKICIAYLKEKNASWNNIYEALKAAKCDDLAALINACFI